MKKFSYLKLLVYNSLVIIVGWIIACIYVSINGLTIEQFDSFSSPQAFFGSSFVDLGFRLIDSFIFPDWLGVTMILAIPALAWLVYSIVFFKKRTEVKKSKRILLSITLLIFNALVAVLCLAFIPGIFIRTIYDIRARQYIHSEMQNISTMKLDIDRSNIVRYVSNFSNPKVYADYGSGGVFLASIMENKMKDNKKLTHFESFYLPVFLSKNDIKTGNNEVDTAEMILVDNNTLVLTHLIKKQTLNEILAPFAVHILRSAYPEFIKSEKNPLKLFAMVEDADFKSIYKSKSISNMEKDIAANEKAFADNQSIIDGYQGFIGQNEKEYQSFVVAEEVRYQSGCVQSHIYNDCTDFRNTIDKNKVTLSENKRIATENYYSAIRINKEITATLSEQRKSLQDIKDGVNQLEDNKGEYSVGVAFNNDTIYVRFYKDNPITGETLRTIVHELLHVYSYQMNTDTIPVAINEGTTDYLALKALGYSDLDAIRASGYHLEIQVVMALLERIPLKELNTAYFITGEPGLKKLMTRYFPQVDYLTFSKDTEKIFKATFNVDGSGHTFVIALIDHPDVIEIRKLLGLDEKKFDSVIY